MWFQRWVGGGSWFWVCGVGFIWVRGVGFKGWPGFMGWVRWVRGSELLGWVHLGSSGGLGSWGGLVGFIGFTHSPSSLSIYSNSLSSVNFDSGWFVDIYIPLNFAVP